MSGLALLAGCGGSAGGTEESSHSGDVSRSDFEAHGKKWPLTVDSGRLECRLGDRITFTTGGTTYSVNGLAKGAHQWKEIDPIWADDGSGLGTKVNISDLIEAGHALCD